MPFLRRDGLEFHLLDAGEGPAFVFLHGLGGNVGQPAGLRPEGVRLISMDARGHGETRPLGDETKLNFMTFADDVVALLDHLGLGRAIVGGISLGAGVALNLALRHSDRVTALVLSRPAWLDAPDPPNLRAYATISRLIRERGAQAGREAFLHTGDFQAVLEASPDAANSLLGQFDRPRAEEAVAVLERLPHDAPSRDRTTWRSIRAPTLVLGSALDPVHPLEYAQTLSHLISGARLIQVTPKSINLERHVQDVRDAISGWVAELNKTAVKKARL